MHPKWLSCLGPLYFPVEEGTDLKGVELNVGELAKEDVDGGGGGAGRDCVEGGGTDRTGNGAVHG